MPREPLPVAGLPAAVRTAHRLATQEGIGQVFLCGASEDLLAGRAAFARLPVRTVSREELGLALTPDAGVLVVAPDGMPGPGGLRLFREEAERARRPAVWTWKGRPVCLYEPDAGRLARRAASLPPNLLEAMLEESAARPVEAPEAEWVPLGSPSDLAAAEEGVYAGLSHGRDGYISQFDRRISIGLSRRLNKTKATPNQITAVSIVVGLVGAVLIASPDWGACLAGALLAWFSSILDGCDGEIARLKLLFSDAGRKFDLFGDYLVNFSVLAAVAWHVHRTRPEVPLGPVMLLLATGVALAALLAWWLFVRKPGNRPQGLLRAFQRLASRDFVYLIVALAAVGRLEWFLYGAAAGAHLFWIGLSLAAAFRRSGAAVS